MWLKLRAVVVDLFIPVLLANSAPKGKQQIRFYATVERGMALDYIFPDQSSPWNSIANAIRHIINLLLYKAGDQEI